VKAKYVFMMLPVLLICLYGEWEQHKQVEETLKQAEHLRQQTVELDKQVKELDQQLLEARSAEEEDSKLLEGCVMHMDTSLVDAENAEIAKRDGGPWTDNDEFTLIQQRKRDGGRPCPK
jgi:cell shape-determining protein MreC